MEQLDLPLLTVGENKVKRTRGDLLSKIGAIKWTNKRDIPRGYNYNEEGWLETNIPYPKVSVTSPAFLSDKYFTPCAILLQNLLALRFLNNKPHELLLQILLRKFAKHNYYYTNSDLDWVRNQSLKITSPREFPPMDRSIWRWDTLWASELGRAQINKRKTIHHISDTREDMNINQKYRTLPVKEAAGTTLYAVKEYWKDMGWNSKLRSRKAILEALEINEEATVKELAAIAGLSLSTVRKYLPKSETQ